MELQLQTQGQRENVQFLGRNITRFESICVNVHAIEETWHKTSPYISHQNYTNIQVSGSKDAKCNDLGAKYNLQWLPPNASINSLLIKL